MRKPELAQDLDMANNQEIKINGYVYMKSEEPKKNNCVPGSLAGKDLKNAGTFINPEEHSRIDDILSFIGIDFSPRSQGQSLTLIIK